ncbi:alpha-N-acetylgalactosaminidase-like isoform X1 [Mya arenaria]|uniref:alpha-N-acetylgalactosaminidase-like isoform X1 n=1 Tax=Mya arenaria TaxID=6604 RepID=UPI0022E6A0E2|nr:alpha-N-acetylgalactosaminidase-like isoform X1 [Mya arenaria]
MSGSLNTLLSPCQIPASKSVTNVWTWVDGRIRTMISVVALVVCLAGLVWSLDNGLARTPPMGWLSWQRYRCNTDCVQYPDDCISEKLYMRMADLLVSEGYRDLGYKYVNIDDCWMSRNRSKDGSLQPDPVRFPNGIKSLANYVHLKGLKLGIYEDFGTKTCGGYPGSKFYLQQDAETFAAWGIDMVKLDGCYTDVSDMDEGYPIMGFYLNQTGRPMLYSCSWPAYIKQKDFALYQKIAKYCNIWRNYNDIGDSWDDVSGIIEYYGKDGGNFSKVAGPGNFNDPDMIILGDYGLSYDQQRVQMAMWAIMASPLLMSNNLETVKPESKALLQNRRIIAINQDPLGIQGTRIVKMNGLEIWVKPLAPKGKSIAFAFLNLNHGGGPSKVSYPLNKLGAMSPQGYNVTDGFTGKLIGTYKSKDKVTVMVNPTGIFLGVANFLGQ